MTNTNAQTTPRIFKSLAMAALVMAFSTTTHAVTFQRTGIFDDGGTWTLTAEFPEAALDDWNVFVSEMTVFDIATAGGNTTDFPPQQYTLQHFQSLPQDVAIVFDNSGTFANLWVTPTTSPLILWSQNFIAPAIEPNNISELSIFFGVVREDNPTDSIGDPLPFGPLADHLVNAAIPEPLTATLGLMGLGVLGMATRRRAG